MAEPAKPCSRLEMFENRCTNFVCSYERTAKGMRPSSSCPKSHIDRYGKQCLSSFSAAEIPVGTTISFRFPPGSVVSPLVEREMHALGRIKGVVKEIKKSGTKHFFRLDWNSVEFLDSPGVDKAKVEEVKKKYFGNRFYNNVRTGTSFILNSAIKPLCNPKIYKSGGSTKKRDRKPKCNIRHKTKKYTTRPSPAFSANDCKGKKRLGNDKSYYISKKTKKGIYRWKKVVKSKKSPK